MRWKLLGRNELTDALARHREEQGTRVSDSLEDLRGIDIRAVASLLSAGQTHLILRSKTADVYNGLDLSSDEDWARIERAAVFLVDAAVTADRKKERAPKKRRKSASRKKPSSLFCHKQVLYFVLKCWARHLRLSSLWPVAS